MVTTNNKSQEKLENYRKDHRYLMDKLKPIRGIEVNEKKYSLIKDYDIYGVFEYFFAEEDKQKCEAFYENFINQNLIKHDVIKVFLEDENGIRKTEFNRVTKKFNGQKTYDISELYFCRESFLRADWLMSLLISTSHLIVADKEMKLRILAKINEIKELQYFSEIIEGLIELKIIANGEEICKPFEFGETINDSKLSRPKQNIKGENESEKNDGDEEILELNLIDTRANFFVVSLVDFRKEKKEIFRSSEVNCGSQHGRFIKKLCDSFLINNLEFIKVNPVLDGLADKVAKVSKFPNQLGFKENDRDLKSLFFEGMLSNQNVVFYKKITQKRLVEKGLQNKI
jgi:hypothetical protein